MLNPEESSDFLYHIETGAIIDRTTHMAWLEMAIAEGWKLPKYVPLPKNLRETMRNTP